MDVIYLLFSENLAFASNNLNIFAGNKCTPRAIEDFPADFFTDKQRQDGGIVVHIFISLYLFVALAVVCDKFFVPAVEKICQALNMSSDVAGATFMAAATSAPELFVNVIGTFITEGDIGVGTIVGSAVFNILAVSACCGIGAGMCGVQVVPLDWWPLTRDCLAYGITVSILICIIHDERVEWYEALCLVLLYTVYILIMYFDKSIQKCVRGGIKQAKRQVRRTPLGTKQKRVSIEAAEADLPVPNEKGKEICVIGDDLSRNDGNATNIAEGEGPPAHINGSVRIPVAENVEIQEQGKPEIAPAQNDEEHLPNLWRWPAKRSRFTQKSISFVLNGAGHGSMGISNSIGSNTFDILLCLGLPWFIKATFMPIIPGKYWVGINSAGIEYSAISLLSSLLLLYVVFALNKFKLDKRVGRICLLMYAVFLILASLIELNAFFRVNLPTCP
ncbi:sodium/potassium/calcium exchanger [Holotrichia oblita]|uniref:Sodium/potassium/calcium exchanger n=1 Tax=Holotrichia oblita TaxID=644536 RepID=A0ACB9TI26_HOLOL|nr:sodium/potassium/calcium exchanger [Holotrichia oblita]